MTDALKLLLFSRRPLTIVAVLLIGLAWLAIQSRGPDQAAAVLVDVTVGEIEQVDAVLNQDILKVRHGRLRHYDPPNAEISRLRELIQTLREAAAVEPAGHATLGEQIDNLQSLLNRKEMLFERFKGWNALYLNSIMYFPMAAERLADALTTTQSASAQVRSPQIYHTYELLRAVLVYARNGEAAWLAQIEHHARMLETLHAAEAAPIQRLIAPVIQHARFVVELKPRVDAATDELLALSVRQHTRPLLTIHGREQAAQSQRANAYRVALALYSAALLFYVIYLFWHLQSGARSLTKANAGLAAEILERKQAQAALYAEKERAEVTLQSIGDAVITLDDNSAVTYLNPVAEALTGWRNAEAAGQPLEAVFRVINEVTREPATDPIKLCLREGKLVKLANHTLLIGRDGREIPIEDSAAPIRNREARIIGVVIVFHDVSSERTLRDQLSWETTHDWLTGLVNRREFEACLERAIHGALGGQHEHVLLYLDLDQFKVVNDTCGHVAGDELLRQLTTVLRAQLREADVIARIGGDEFGVLLESCPISQANRIADQLRQAVKDSRFAWGERSFDVGVSIGLVPITATSGNRAAILSAADIACYVAKDRGRNRVHVYQEDDAALTQRHSEMQWLPRITKAFEEDRMRLYYQPIAALTGKQDALPHGEILIRMLDEAGEIVLPEAFLPAAERYNLMPTIDRWVVRHTLAICRQRCDRGLHELCIINLSAVSINEKSFLDFLHDVFKQAEVPPERFCFEITETAAIANLSKTASFMKEFKTLGFRFSLDDFGSGLSSFSYLKNLPVDYLKIDGGFVRDMIDDPIDDAMVQAINQIGHVMKIQTVAESVESEAILQRLKEIGVDYAQGYAISRPAPFALD